MMAKNTFQDEDIKGQMIQIGKDAKDAAYILANADSDAKNQALLKAASNIRENKPAIIAANQKDVEAAKQKNIDKAMLDRLILNDSRIESMAKGLEDIAALEDPVGKILGTWERPNGLEVSRVSTPLGVIGIIYESRPNVTADAGALCIKSGNAVILRGGSESFHSSTIIAQLLADGLKESGLPESAIQLVPTTDRQAVGEMLKLDEYIDVIIPRGGKGLCSRVKSESTIPTLLHLDGNCHTYVNKSASKEMAVEVITNAKMRRTGICGATESIVIDKDIAGQFIPEITSALNAEGCEVRGDELARQIDERIKPASDDDWSTEYLDAIVSIRIVSGITEAIDFVNQHSSKHTEAVIAEDENAANQFLSQIASAIVMWNTSTQFADGGEFGMGAEIGISTGKLHARGPVGVDQLNTFKYVVKGSGQIRPGG